MTEFSEVNITRILNPTSIDLGEYVINPFMGCEFSCLYCYVRSNRVISRKNKPWGEYVNIRINAPELLEKEIRLKKPKVVLLGSTTECFQPIEAKYQLTKRLLEVLNKYEVKYVILTRSPYIQEYLSLLKQGFCQKIYFTINQISSEFKLKLEPGSPGFDLRDKAVNILLDEGLQVIPYFSPLLPWISDIKNIFLKFEKAEVIEFECLNFSLQNIQEIINHIGLVNPTLKRDYEKMMTEQLFFMQTWQAVKKDIENQAATAKKKHHIYIHNFGGYFKNRYF